MGGAGEGWGAKHLLPHVGFVGFFEPQSIVASEAKREGRGPGDVASRPPSALIGLEILLQLSTRFDISEEKIGDTTLKLPTLVSTTV